MPAVCFSPAKRQAAPDISLVRWRDSIELPGRPTSAMLMKLKLAMRHCVDPRNWLAREDDLSESDFRLLCSPMHLSCFSLQIWGPAISDPGIGATRHPGGRNRIGATIAIVVSRSVQRTVNRDRPACLFNSTTVDCASSPQLRRSTPLARWTDRSCRRPAYTAAPLAGRCGRCRPASGRFQTGSP
jgi:hypothetical protein